VCCSALPILLFGPPARFGGLWSLGCCFGESHVRCHCWRWFWLWFLWLFGWLLVAGLIFGPISSPKRFDGLPDVFPRFVWPLLDWRRVLLPEDFPEIEYKVAVLAVTIVNEIGFS
jgi:hypothetical protein